MDLISLTDIKSEKIIGGLVDYYVKGHSLGVAATLNGESKGNLSTAKSSLDAKAEIVWRITERENARKGYGFTQNKTNEVIRFDKFDMEIINTGSQVIKGLSNK
ncbi:hypothetical protein [Shewanella sp.]|uniref:hypothetical protein n=1 Tax=Shewanella sp. TaxID=50422 RepID=UPI003A9722C6